MAQLLPADNQIRRIFNPILKFLIRNTCMIKTEHHYFQLEIIQHNMQHALQDLSLLKSCYSNVYTSPTNCDKSVVWPTIITV